MSETGISSYTKASLGSSRVWGRSGGPFITPSDLRRGAQENWGFAGIPAVLL